MLHTPLRQLTDLFSTLRSIVLGIRRDKVLFAPNSGDQLFAGDEIYIMSHVEDGARTLEILVKQKRSRIG